jgi:hypothetical protein
MARRPPSHESDDGPVCHEPSHEQAPGESAHGAQSRNGESIGAVGAVGGETVGGEAARFNGRGLTGGNDLGVGERQGGKEVGGVTGGSDDGSDNGRGGAGRAARDKGRGELQHELQHAAADGAGGPYPEYVPDVEVSAFDYDLPHERIAVRPCEPRDASKLLVYTHGTEGAELGRKRWPLEQGDAAGEGDGRAVWGIRDHVFRDAPALVPAGAVLVLNDSKVVAARLIARKKTTGGSAEVMLLSPEQLDGSPTADPAVALGAGSGTSVWGCLIRGRNIKVGDVLVCQDTGTAGSRGEGGDGEHGIELEALIEAKNGPDASVRLSWRVEGGAVLRYGRNVSLREVDRVGWDGGWGGGVGGESLPLTLPSVIPSTAITPGYTSGPESCTLHMSSLAHALGEVGRVLLVTHTYTHAHTHT